MWLVVTGAGIWSPERGTRFQPGLHEVDDRIAALARENPAKCWVGDVKPTIRVDGAEAGMLTMEDIVIGAQPGVKVITEDGVVEEEEPEGGILVDGGWACRYCEAEFPSVPARERHVWKQHSEAAQLAGAEEEPEPEVSSTV